MKKLARKVGVSVHGSKLDIINRVKAAIDHNNSGFNKLFKKMFGRSCGWLSLACTHGVVYALKFLLRAESPRDYIDILCSLKYRPNMSIVDMAHMVASHGNRFEEDFFSPHQGRVAADTPDNIEQALNDTFEVSFPWLDTNNPCYELDENCSKHPVTGSDVTLALFDKFHESNTSSERESLRRIGCVKELRGKINSQVVEQSHGSYNKNMHFMNQMSPLNHIFLFRSIIDLQNESRNKAFIRDKETQPLLNISFDVLGRAVFGHDENFFPSNANFYDPGQHVNPDVRINLGDQGSNCSNVPRYNTTPPESCHATLSESQMHAYSYNAAYTLSPQTLPDFVNGNGNNPGFSIPSWPLSDNEFGHQSPGVAGEIPSPNSNCHLSNENSSCHSVDRVSCTTLGYSCEEQLESLPGLFHQGSVVTKGNVENSASVPVLIDDSTCESWNENLSLTQHDKFILASRRPLTPSIICAALQIIKSECESFAGLQQLSSIDILDMEIPLFR